MVHQLQTENCCREYSCIVHQPGQQHNTTTAIKNEMYKIKLPAMCIHVMSGCTMLVINHVSCNIAEDFERQLESVNVCVCVKVRQILTVIIIINV